MGGKRNAVKAKLRLFDETAYDSWREEWKDMPEYVQEDLTSFRKIVVHFQSQEDVDAFAKLIGQRITPKQPSLWYPPHEIRRYANKRYMDEP